MKLLAMASAIGVALAASSATAATVLYNQNFNDPNPVGPGSAFQNDGGDINITRPVNQLYGNQPAGFQFAQNFTTETLLIGGNQAFGVGYSDPSGIGGLHTLGLLSGLSIGGGLTNDDLLGLAFNVGGFDFLNLRADISSIDLDRFGGPFVPTGTPASIPIFKFSLFNNPSGAVGTGAGLTLLGSFTATGLANPSKTSFLFSEATGGLNATGSPTGNVILQIDLLQGGYAAIDNLRVVASDIEGDVGLIPEPATWLMMILGFGAVGASMRCSRRLNRRAPA